MIHSPYIWEETRTGSDVNKAGWSSELLMYTSALWCTLAYKILTVSVNFFLHDHDILPRSRHVLQMHKFYDVFLLQEFVKMLSVVTKENIVT